MLLFSIITVHICIKSFLFLFSFRKQTPSQAVVRYARDHAANAYPSVHEGDSSPEINSSTDLSLSLDDDEQINQ